MVEEINKALSNYRIKWQSLAAERTDKPFFEQLIPVSVGWKVTDIATFDKVVALLRGHCDLVVHTRLNNRWIAKMVLRKPITDWLVPVVKIMQIRPGSADALGLDHVDFYSPQTQAQIETTLQTENLTWSHEVNHHGDKYPWASVWFAGTEAKIKHYSVLDIYAGQLAQVSARIKQNKG